MSSTQYIYLQHVPQKKLQAVIEETLRVSVIPSTQPEWFFYYEDKNISISAGVRQTLDPDHAIPACTRPVTTEMMLLIDAPTYNIAGADIVAVKCLNAILKEFNTDVIFMYEDDTLRLVRCEGQIFINWSGSLEEPNFWNRPTISILDELTVPYTMQNLEQKLKSD